MCVSVCVCLFVSVFLSVGDGVYMENNEREQESKHHAGNKKQRSDD